MTCEQFGCAREADGAFAWPGNDLRAACEGHLATARRVATAMGFTLIELPLEMREATLAHSAAFMLGGVEASRSVK